MISVEQVGGEVKISFFDENGINRVMKTRIPDSQAYNWTVAGPKSENPISPNYRSQYGKEICKKKSHWLDKYRLREYMDSFPEKYKKLIFSNNKPKKFYMDIETEMIDGFPDTKVAKEKITSYSYCDEFCNGVVSGLKELSFEAQDRLQARVNEYFAKTGKKFNIKFKHYESETQMMMNLVYHEIPTMPWIAGWNFLKFDWAYMHKRAENLGIDFTRTSPTGKLEKYTFKEKFNKKQKWEVNLPMHRAVIDYLMIYERWDSVVKFKDNVSLDHVAKEVLGYEKVKYAGSLQDFYENDYEGFIFYNMVDTILVQLIDERLLTFNTMFAIANDCRIKLMDAIYTSIGVEAKMQDQFNKKGVKFVPRGRIEKDEDSYSGGWVYEPEIGLKELLTIFDFASQFPSLMSAFNLGIDTYIGKKVMKKVNKVFNNQEVEMLEWTGEVLDLNGNPMEIDPVNHITTTFGTIFDKREESTLRCYIAEQLNQRLAAKKASAELETEILNLKEILSKTAA